MDFLIGFFCILGGLAVMRYRYHIYELTGEWSWANTYLGGNGTVTAIALIGMLLIAGGVAFPFGLKEQLTTPPKLTAPVNQR